MPAAEPICVVKTPAILGESVLWHPVEKKVYWLDLKGPAIHIYDPASKAADIWQLELDVPMGTLVRAREGFVLTGREGTFKVDMAARKLTPWVNPNDRPELTMFNDGKVDRQGRLWLCTSDNKEVEPIGGIYSLSADGKSEIHDRGFACGNGPGFSPDGRIFYFSDTMVRKVYAYDLDPRTGALAGQRIFTEFTEEQGMPDGMTVDAEGGIWICHWEGWRVTRFLPSGEIDREIRLPVPLVTSCAFAGEALDTLYITTATVGLDAAALARAPLAGSLFAVKTGHRGLPEPVFGQA
ncbi:SMP-30/gluconolactonase/LRE family protein [Dongia sp.]|uniref:SMP-30/gluconolactonase/LRE family protein n=1 Tax=Dongia sp. TaxID=1977262 RepID=UPI0035B3D644